MIIGKVVGHVWATKKEETLSGMKLMVVRRGGEPEHEEEPVFVAADIVGAGIGERVLVVNGSTARKAFGREDTPIDAAIVGIIDAIEMEKEE